MSRQQIPPRPPRKREQPRWRQPQWLLLIAGSALVVVGLLGIYGPFAADLGGTESPSPDAAADDPSGATASDNDHESDESSGETNGADGYGTENDGIRGMIGALSSGDDDPERADDDEREKCTVE